MLTNDRVQALAACDREALLALMALAYRQGSRGYPIRGDTSDLDIIALLAEAAADAWPNECAERRALNRWWAWAQPPESPQ